MDRFLSASIQLLRAVCQHGADEGKDEEPAARRSQTGLTHGVFLSIVRIFDADRGCAAAAWGLTNLGLTELNR